ncbi:hypothetical protein ACQPWY_00065 [Pseudonocardia xinjiangensis]|uniref:hypothetical protein n=1 Tax=Pseudonocardia xinjiangensis TaxID=75289 RepID=UPI003D8EA9C9
MLGDVPHEIGQDQRWHGHRTDAGVGLGVPVGERAIVAFAQGSRHFDDAVDQVDVESAQVHQLTPPQARERAQQHERPEPRGYCHTASRTQACQDRPAER